MPYTILVQSANFHRDDGESIDPVSGWGMPSFVDTGLTDEQRRNAILLLTSRGGRRPGVDDRVHVTLPDGSFAEVHLVGLFGGCPCLNGHFTAGEPSPEFLRLVVELADVANLILRPQDFPRPLVVGEERRSRLIVRYPQVQSAFSAAMLRNLLVPRPVEPEPEADAPAE